MYRARVAISGLLCYNDFMNELDTTQKKLFDDLRHIDENGNEYWLARELQTALQYTKWENFHKVIKTAQIACKISQQSVADCFPEVRKSIISGKGRKSEIIDYKLTRYACFLIVMNGDPRKDVIAWGQTYFAVKTQQQELAANLFRITQTEAKMRREGTDTPQKANVAHYQVGKAVRETIKGLGGTMPEDLPTPEKSIKELEAETRKQLKSKKTDPPCGSRSAAAYLFICRSRTLPQITSVKYHKSLRQTPQITPTKCRKSPQQNRANLLNEMPQIYKVGAAYHLHERAERFDFSLSASFSTNFPLDKIICLSYNIYIIVIMLN